MFGEDFLMRALLWGPVILLSLTVHEFAHAWSAHKFGDDTAKNMGRLTFNPLAHLDMMGTIVMVVSQFTFGWAKPVPVNIANLRNPRVADIWISAAGPISNLGMAIIAGLLYQTMGQPGATEGGAAYFTEILRGGVFINLALAAFNMIPIFPLDGSHILGNLLPRRYQASYERFNQYAPFLLIIIVITGVFWAVVGPVVATVASVLLGHF
ncbi:site-2 protease family protein [candidate division GN15 bacterium]|nr:site-2 protease family protein [candidate division GN15 bacterium]